MSENTKIVTEALNDLTNLPAFKELVARFKECNLNPFKFKTDGTAEGFAGLVEANKILGEIIHLGITTVERRCADLKLSLTSEEKLDVVAQFLDDQVKLNVLLEPFDRIVFKILITQAVGFLNRTFGKAWLDRLPAPNPNL